MCDSHGAHVTMIKGALRCVLCGHRVGFRTRLRLRDLPSEIWGRHKAREAWWNTPVVSGGSFYY